MADSNALALQGRKAIADIRSDCVRSASLTNMDLLGCRSCSSEAQRSNQSAGVPAKPRSEDSQNLQNRRRIDGCIPFPRPQPLSNSCRAQKVAHVFIEATRAPSSNLPSFWAILGRPGTQDGRPSWAGGRERTSSADSGTAVPVALAIL